MKRSLLQLYLLILVKVVLYSNCLGQDESLVIKTSSGLLRGRLQSITDGLLARQFLGIPFAQPPVGPLRFARPKPVQPWDGVRDAVEYGPMCPQVSMHEAFKSMNISNDSATVEVPQSEDCLSLNVYTPSTATASDKLSVMVWIHGGGFAFGTGRSYDPSLIAALNNVIVVTINYRLGVLGFFNIPGTDVKGNFAMHDQVESLKWVQQNIAAFGGNPDQVTIFGESAGAMSVSSHLISPLSKGLFHRGIAQSGSSATPYTCLKVISTKALDIFNEVLKCDGTDDKLMDCLREKSVEDIIAAQANVTYPLLTEDQFLTSITVDGEFLPDEPKILLKEGKINKADVMTGLTGNEGAMSAMFFMSKGVNLDSFRFSVQASLSVTGLYTQLVADAVEMEYLDHSDINNTVKLRQGVMDMGTDLIFIAPVVMEANFLSKTGNPVYLYVFDHSPHHSKFPAWLGAYHGVDLSYVFGAPIYKDAMGDDIKFFLPGNYSSLEEGFSKYTIKMWTNFAKYGNPNGVEPMPVTWPAYNNTGHAYLSISMEPKVKYGLRERQVVFWNEFIPKLRGIKTETAESKQEERKKEEL